MTLKNLTTAICLLIVGFVLVSVFFLNDYYVIYSFHTQSVEPQMWFTQLHGTDRDGKEETLYSSSFSKSIQSQVFANAGICYEMYVSQQKGDPSAPYYIFNSIPTTCQTNE